MSNETLEKPQLSALFQPIQAGAISLKNRILLAPLTRARADAGHLPNAMMAEYYAQRASGGLVITEATMAMEGNGAFIAEPGIYSDEQVERWQTVVEAVHARGGRIVVQLWHGGRACHPLMNGGRQPVAPSAIPITDGQTFTPEGLRPYVTPRALETDEIPEIVAGFQKAAKNAKAAGFDGVEIHGANSYLIDEFLRDGSNHRTDQYGGSLENRARLLFEVLDAVAEVQGKDRVGLRLSPVNPYNSMSDSDPVGLTRYLATRMDQWGGAYLHVMRGGPTHPELPDVLGPVRENYHGVLIANKGYTPAEANAAISEGQIDAVTFGIPFLSNPDLPERIAAGAALNAPDYDTFYAGGPKGYIDYPTMAE